MQTIAKNLGLLFLFSFLFQTSFSQESKTHPEKTIEGSKKVRIDEKSKQIKFVQLKSDYFFSAVKEDSWLKKTLDLSSDHATQLVGKITDKQGFTHTKYQFLYKNIPVDGSVFIVHSKNGKIHAANGESVIKENISVTPSISETQAFSEAIKFVNAHKYKWEIDENFSQPSGNLVIVKIDTAYALAYKIDIYAVEPLSRQYIYISAKNGDVLKTVNRIHIANANGTAKTMYNGNVTISTDSYNNSYRLRETLRGGGIETYNLNHSTSYSTAEDFTDDDNQWTDTVDYNHAANDAHYGTEATYDFYHTKFDRNSFDGNGGKMVSYVHYSRNYVNAFWDGSAMTYGDGDGVTFLPLTAIEVVGHEITHGVTEHSAGLNYWSESGALNESFSDIFGTAIDFYKNPTKANYLIGDVMSVSHTPFRSMQNPNDYNCPDTYRGLYWSQYEEVHTNSGVQNFWFYLLCEGGSGTNDLGNNYTVTAIGREKATQIAYRNLTTYLTPSSDFEDARFYSIQSAIDLYGDCSQEVIAVTNAWYAVGVGSSYDNSVVSGFLTSKINACDIPAQIIFYNKSFKASSYNWDFGDGSTDTARNPVHIFQRSGKFLVKLIAKGDAFCNNSDTSRREINVISGSSPVAPSCTPRTMHPGSGGIYEFRFNTINKISNGSTEDYQDFTCTDVANIKEGNKYFISGKVGENNLENLYVWIDFNNNGLFTELGEKVYEKRNITKTFADSIILPAGSIYSVPLRMRVGSDYASSPALTSCSSSNYGQFHDYSVILEQNTSVPTPIFTTSKRKLVSGDTIQFRDASLNLPTSWSWSFPGGSPSTSNLKNPKVSYSTPGIYDVTLIASNSHGSSTVTKTEFITVTTPAPIGLRANIEDQMLGKVSLRWYTASNDNVFEDFDDNTADNFVYSDNNFVVENGYFKSSGTGDNTWKCAYYNQIFSDFLLEYKFRQGQPNYYSTGAFFRADGFLNRTNSNGYLVNVLSSGSYGAWKIVNGVSTNIIPWSATNAINTTPDSWNIVNIEAVGNTIKIYVNSQYVDEFTDNSFSSGLINLGSYFGSGNNFDIRWDYFNVVQENAFNINSLIKSTTKVLEGEGDFTKSPVHSLQNSSVEIKGFDTQTGSRVNNTNAFRYFKIFRDSVVIKTTTNAFYTDTLPHYGNYRYFVTSLYDEGESEPTNKLNVKWEEMNPGENCLNAQNLQQLTSPYTSSIVGYINDFTTCYMDYSPDRIFYIDVPKGGRLRIGQTTNNFDSRHSIRIGKQCPGNIEYVCVDEPDEQQHVYLNNTDSTQRLYYILAGYGSGFGSFTLGWDLQTPSKPIPDFSASSNVITSGTMVNFTDLTRGVPSSWKWYFQGGSPSSSTSQNPSVLYNTLGTFDVKLVARNYLGTDSVIKSSHITVSNLKYCKTNLGGDGTCPGDITGLSIKGTSLNNTVHSNCNVANGTTYGFYPPSGSTTATLKNDSTYEFSVTTSKSDIVSVWIDYNQNSIFEPSEWSRIVISTTPNIPAKVNITIPSNAVEGQTGLRIRSRASGSDYGEADACTFFDSGITEDYLITIVKQASKPKADFISQTEVKVNEQVNFHDLSTGVPTSWKWYFTGGSPAFSISAAPVITYGTAGKYNVKLIVSNSLGSDSVTKNEYISIVDNNPGDDCSSAQNLANLTSPFTGTTVGYNSNIYICNSSPTPDRIFYLDVPNGSILKIGQSYNNFDSRHTIRIGNTCPGNDVITCIDDPDEQTYSYNNTTGTTQRLYYVLGGYNSSNYGDFTLSWKLDNSALPKAVFSASNNIIQMNSNVEFTDNSTGIPSSRKWYFEGGNPNYSETEKPYVYYNTPGIYDVKLVVSNSLGKDSIVKTDFIQVLPPPKPIASFNCSNTLVKSGNSIYFNDNSYSNVTSRKWYFEGGTPSYSDQYYQTVVYNSSGIYDVKLVVTNAGGTDSITRKKYITVTNELLPVANFYANKTESITTEGIYFTDNSANSPSSYRWKFDGGSPSESNNSSPYVTYSNPGTYSVKLAVRNSIGADSIVKENYIHVSLPPKPVPNFNVNSSTITTGNSVYFSDISTNIPTSYYWSFSGGSPSTSTYSNPVITYSKPGTYDVKLVVSNAGGKDSITKTGFINVVNTLPGENCENAMNLSQLTSPFSGSTSGYKNDFSFCSFYTPDRIFYIDVPNTYTLKIGQTYNDFDSRHSIRVGTTCPGNTELVCTDDPDYEVYTYVNSTGTSQRLYYILGGYSYSTGNFKLGWNLSAPNSAPDANFTSDKTNIQPSNNIYFTDQSAGSPTTWQWYFSGGNPSTSNYSNPSVYYTSPGSYQVKLIVSNSFGRDTLIRNNYITVNPPPKPVAIFSVYSNKTSTGVPVSFNDNSSNNPTSRKWTFTGGTPVSSTSSQVSVTYANPGLYDVKLVVSNAGGKDSVIKTKFITVSPQNKPIANFNAGQTNILVDNYVYFTDNSGYNPSSWRWILTGGNPSTSEYSNPYVRYESPGMYNVKLIVSNSGGKDSIVKNDYIKVELPPKPVANFFTNNTSVTTGSYVYFYDNSTSNPTSYKWTFSGGTPASSTYSSPSVVYNEPGLYSVKLVVSNRGGADSITKTAYIRVSLPPKPQAVFYGSPTTIVRGSSVYFYSNSTNNPSSYYWTFPGGSPSSSTNSSSFVNYETPGVYTVKLTVANNGGSDSITRINYITVTLPPKPVAMFSSDVRQITQGSSINFYNNSTNDPTLLRWEFSGGSPSSSTSSSPVVTYNTAGDYDVKLVATNAWGSDSVISTGYARVSPYCISNLGGGWCPGDIKQVSITGTTLNSLDRTSCSGASGSVYLSFPQSGSTTATLGRGKTYELSVTTSNYDIISAWIDYNQNGVFDNSEWTQVTTSSTPNVSSKVNINIPATALEGKTMMRIRTRYSGASNSAGNACTYFDSGVTEDYAVTIRDFIKFNVNKNNICQNQSITFNNQSLVNGNSYLWDFGEGATPRLANTSGPHEVTYTSSGYKTVSLNIDGTVLTKSNYVNVYRIPSVFRITSPLSLCSGNSDTLSLNGSETGINYQLYKEGSLIGFPKAGTGTQMRWLINESGRYKITAFVNGNNECAINLPDSVLVNSKFGYTDSSEVSICQDENYTLPDGIRVHVAGEYLTNLKCITGCDSVIITRLHVISRPLAPQVTINQNALISNAVEGNQWYSNETGKITNATSNSYIPVRKGNYYSIVTVNGCSSLYSNEISYIPTSNNELEDGSVSIYPNPITDKLYIKVEKEITISKIEVRNTLGAISKLIVPEDEIKLFEIDLSDEAGGYYTVIIYSANKIFKYKLIKVN